MDVDSIRSLYAYHQWVTDRLYDLAQQVPEERLTEQFGASFDSIFGTLVHLASAENTWLARWEGKAASPFPLSMKDAPDLLRLRTRWSENRRELGAFLDRLSDERLAAPIRWTNSSGVTVELPLWQPMVQIVNHGTHHRSELCDMLTRVGSAPPPTDIIIFFEEQAGYFR
jgi:uncharacterized damage-inducible protein DinB